MDKCFYRLKAARMETAEQIDEAVMGKINAYTRRELSPEEVYTFGITLCDNEVDRDNEAFTAGVLTQLGLLFIGKTVITDHIPRAANQTARIYSTSIIPEPGRRTSYDEPYMRLDAECYMLRGEDTESTIRRIDAGILKEISVGCSVGKALCSICGRPYYTSECNHRKQTVYDGKPCYIVLDDAKDAYEVSFVAVPAQLAAGVHKGHERIEETGAEIESLTNAVKALGIEIHTLISRLDSSDYGSALQEKPTTKDNNLDPEVEALIRRSNALIKNMKGDL